MGHPVLVTTRRGEVSACDKELPCPSQKPAGQKFGPCHQRTECIENLSPSWDETHYDMDLVGNDWLNLSPSSQYLMDRFLDTTLSGGSGDQYDPTHTRPLGYYDQTDLPFS